MTRLSRRFHGWPTLATGVVGFVLVVASSCASAPSGPGALETRAAASAASRIPPIQHVFIINLENKGFDETWGPDSPAPYLSKTLRSKGALLSQYYGTAHNSLHNYVAEISGQGPNAQNQGDCQIYSAFQGMGTYPPGQLVGDGCVFPEKTPTLPGQLQTAGLTWKAYMQDMGRPCRHPKLGSVDHTQQAEVGDQYAARHNPFVYFADITASPDCRADVVDLSHLPADLSATSSTPNFAFITPNLCNDGHDAPCVDGRPGGLISADLWLRHWVPQIMRSPAFQQDGLLVITFDESEGPDQDSTACCGEGPGPNAPLPGISGLGGGLVGALLLSPYIAPGTMSDVPYNHYSLLASVEDIFRLEHIGYARTHGLKPFGHDIFTR